MATREGFEVFGDDEEVYPPLWERIRRNKTYLRFGLMFLMLAGGAALAGVMSYALDSGKPEAAETQLSSQGQDLAASATAQSGDAVAPGASLASGASDLSQAGASAQAILAQESGQEGAGGLSTSGMAYNSSQSLTGAGLPGTVAKIDGPGTLPLGRGVATSDGAPYQVQTGTGAGQGSDPGQALGVQPAPASGSVAINADGAGSTGYETSSTFESPGYAFVAGEQWVKILAPVTFMAGTNAGGNSAVIYNDDTTMMASGGTFPGAEHAVQLQLKNNSNVKQAAVLYIDAPDGFRFSAQLCGGPNSQPCVSGSNLTIAQESANTFLYTAEPTTGDMGDADDSIFIMVKTLSHVEPGFHSWSFHTEALQTDSYYSLPLGE